MVLKKLKRFFTMNNLVRLIGLIVILIFITSSTEYLDKKESSPRQKIECVNQLNNTSDIRNTIEYIKKYIGNSSCNPGSMLTGLNVIERECEEFHMRTRAILPYFCYIFFNF